MRRWLCVLLALALLLCGCGVRTVEQEDALRLYCAAPLSANAGGDAIRYVNVDWDTLPRDDRQAQVEAILSLLLGECEDMGFTSPIPSGTALRSVTLGGSTVWVDFSGAYGQLSGMDLTIADYCLTLSLTQLPGVYAVRITVNGQELAYRDTNLFLAGDVLLSSTEDVVRTLTARLWFPDAQGILTAEERLLTLYEGQSAAEVVLSALQGGPEDESLQKLLPAEFTGMTAHLEDGVCYLNIPSASLELLTGDSLRRQTVTAITDSLYSLEGVSGVEVYVDGEAGPY